LEPSRFATLLRQHRIDCGLSQDALAEAAGISTSAIGAYERGVHSAPHRTTIRMLADALRLDGAIRAEFEGAARRKPRSSSQADRIPAGNLPLPATSFIGRERDLEQLQELFGRHRIVTLTGSGGIGKTRLALRAAAQRAATYQGGVWFVDFGTITDEALVVSQVAIALGVPVPAANSTIESFAAQLQARALLLILDNCEHVVGAAALLAATIVRICPRITILATSRERLRISGEAVVRVPSLPTPGPAPVTLADAQKYPAVALFVERAATVEVDFVLTEAQLDLPLCRTVLHSDEALRAQP